MTASTHFGSPEQLPEERFDVRSRSSGIGVRIVDPLDVGSWKE